MIVILDTETTNTIEQPLPYDFGWIVADPDTKTIVEKRSYVVKEIFLDKELMSTAYFAEKIPSYWEDIKAGRRTIKTMIQIRKILWRDMKKYNCSRIGAYNMGFDKRAARNDCRYITGSWLRWFFPYNVDFFCIWHMACSSFLATPEYINFARQHNFISEKGNILTSAECAYRYIKNQPDFIESHTGLEDSLIEAEIYFHCLKENYPNMKDSLNSACWQKVQKYNKKVLH